MTRNAYPSSTAAAGSPSLPCRHPAEPLPSRRPGVNDGPEMAEDQAARAAHLPADLHAARRHTRAASLSHRLRKSLHALFRDLAGFRRRASAWAGRDAEESGDEVQPAAPASAAGVAADNRESWPPQNRYDQTQTSGID